MISKENTKCQGYIYVYLLNTILWWNPLFLQWSGSSDIVVQLELLISPRNSPVMFKACKGNYDFVRTCTLMLKFVSNIQDESGHNYKNKCLFFAEIK